MGNQNKFKMVDEKKMMSLMDSRRKEVKNLVLDIT